MSGDERAEPRRLMDISDFAPFADGLDHPEGVACGPAGELYAGGEAGQLYRVAPDGAVSTYSPGSPERPMRVPNYPVFDRAGNLYVSDSGGWQENGGCVYLVRPGGAAEVLPVDLAAFPNGLALDATGETLYVVLSNLPGVVAVDLRPGHGLARRTLVELPRQVPDGLALDEAGNLYIACYTPDVVYRLSPEGELAIVADDWASVTFATPTNLAFCGPERRTLVVASLSRWHLTKGEMPIAGQPLNYPKFLAHEPAGHGGGSSDE